MNFEKISELVQLRIETLPEIYDLIDFFQELPEYSADIYVHKKMKTNFENSLLTLEKITPAFEAIDNWTIENIETACMNLVKELSVKNGVVLWPVRTALSGKKFSAGGAYEIADIIGKEESLKRLSIGIEKLKAQFK